MKPTWAGRGAAVTAAMALLALPLAAQDRGDAADASPTAVPQKGQPNLSWWDSEYWQNWEEERVRWRQEWLEYERRYGTLPEELRRVVHRGRPMPHRLDGGATALAEWDSGVPPGTWTGDLLEDRRFARVTRDARGRWVLSDRQRDHDVRRSSRHARADRERRARLRTWYRAVFGRSERARVEDAVERLRQNAEPPRTRDRRRTRRGG